ncbi:hypothetical protein QI600_001950 [Salmonella enterica]|nr:hypothetical protein [Salmonella enterica]
MKEPDIKAIRKEFGIPHSFKFLGFVICNAFKEDYLSEYAASTEAFSFSTWTATPEFALKFKTYLESCDVISRLELQDKTIVMMAFDTGSQIAVGEIPFPVAN